MSYVSFVSRIFNIFVTSESIVHCYDRKKIPSPTSKMELLYENM